MYEMVIGRTNKLSCQTAGGVALDMQKQCREQISSYFGAVPPWEDLPTLGDFLCTLMGERMKNLDEEVSVEHVSIILEDLGMLNTSIN